jgi:hypothetical protein
MPTKPVQTSTQLPPMQEEQSALTVIPKFIEPETILGGDYCPYVKDAYELTNVKHDQCQDITYDDVFTMVEHRYTTFGGVNENQNDIQDKGMVLAIFLQKNPSFNKFVKAPVSLSSACA